MASLQTDDLGLILRALQFSAHKHRDQRRKDRAASPYINHPIALANVLGNEAGIGDARVLAAAILHDTVEDTDTTVAELEREFGPEIAAIVAEVSDDKSLPSPRRKQLQIEHAGQASREARLVKLADKICNLRDISDSPPVGWSRQRQQEYFDWAARVVDALRGTDERLEALFDAVCRAGPGDGQA